MTDNIELPPCKFPDNGNRGFDIKDVEDYARTAILADRARQAPAPVEVSRLAEMEARKDAAYLERNQVVAALAKCFPSGVARTAIEGWSEDWHGCVYIDLPTGQASWHFHDSHAHLFADLPPYTGQWDGHGTPEKYRRLATMASTPASEVPAGCPDCKGSEFVGFKRGMRCATCDGTGAATPASPATEGEAVPDMRAICEALGFDPTNHHNAAKCPYCRPAAPIEVEAAVLIDEETGRQAAKRLVVAIEAGAQKPAPLHAYLSKLPTLDPTWPAQVQEGWMKCFDALRAMSEAEAQKD